MKVPFLFVLVVVSFDKCAAGSCKNDQAKVVMTGILQLLDNLEKTDKCPTSTNVNCEKCSKDPIIAFSATLTRHTDLSAGNVVIVYDKVKTNLGSSYNGKTGIFTVPVKGLYHLTATIMSLHNKDLHVKMYRNSEEIGYGHAASGLAVMGSITSVIELEKGDVVSVRHGHSSRAQPIHGHNIPSFSGYLIRQM